MKPDVFSYLPDEMLTRIMVTISASSLTNFVNLKLCCKRFNTVAEHPNTYKSVSLVTMPYSEVWKHVDFIETCAAHKNPEALYRDGAINFFAARDFVKGEAQLTVAAAAEHLPAKYALAMGFVISDNRDEEQIDSPYDNLSMVCSAGRQIEYPETMMNVLFFCSTEVFHKDDIPRRDARCMQIHWKCKNGWAREYIVLEDPECMAFRCDAEVARFEDEFGWMGFPIHL